MSFLIKGNIDLSSPYRSLKKPKIPELKEKSFYLIYQLACIEDLKRLESLLYEKNVQVVVFEKSKEAASFFLSQEALTPLLKHRNFEWYFIDQLTEDLCLKLSWQSLFLRKIFLSLDEDESFYQLRERIEKASEGVFLVFSEYKDFGKKVFENIYKNTLFFSESYDGRPLALKNIPAIICGAGPSLIKDINSLKKAHDKAIIFAGGSSIQPLMEEEVKIHLAATIDPDPPLERFSALVKEFSGFLYSLRASHQIVKTVTSPKIVFPGSGESFLESYLWKEVALNEESLIYESGWNVANFMATVAARMGCNPIIFVGMDMCYEKRQEYASGVSSSAQGKISEIILDVDGIEKESRKDLLMGRNYFCELVKTFPDRKWINTSLKGLVVEGMLKQCLEDVLDGLEVIENLKMTLDKNVDVLNLIGKKQDFQEIKKNIKLSFLVTKQLVVESLCKLQRVYDQSTGSLNEKVNEGFLALEEVGIETELFYELVLERLWEIWKWVLFTNHQERLETIEGRIQKYLFFEGVMKEFEGVFDDRGI